MDVQGIRPSRSRNPDRLELEVTLEVFISSSHIIDVERRVQRS